MNTSTITLAETDASITDCFSIMRQLRPSLIEADFLPRVRRMQTQGYQLAFAADAAGIPRCAAGFRQMEMLYSGRTLYVDDLVTEAACRSQGYGDHMIDWLLRRAGAAGIEEFSLDSGTQRVDAHRFYMRKRMQISGFHFSLRLKS